MDKRRLAIIVVVAAGILAIINIIQVKQRQDEAARVEESQALAEKLLAKASVTMRLEKAEKQLTSGQPEEGLAVIRQFAADGDVRALHDLGWIYRQGMGVEQDYSEALVWFKKAAEVGKAPDSYSAAYYIGEIYQKGLGVPADQEEAITWLKVARDHGVEEAEAYLKTLGVE